VSEAKYRLVFDHGGPSLPRFSHVCRSEAVFALAWTNEEVARAGLSPR